MSRASLEVALGAIGIEQQITPELIPSPGQELYPISVLFSKKQVLYLSYLAGLLANRRVHSAVLLSIRATGVGVRDPARVQGLSQPLAVPNTCPLPA